MSVAKIPVPHRRYSTMPLFATDISFPVYFLVLSGGEYRQAWLRVLGAAVDGGNETHPARKRGIVSI